MENKEEVRILDELSEFRKEVKSAIEKIFDQINLQNERIICSEKDIQYLEEKGRENLDQLEKDITNFFLRFREFKELGVKKIIQEEILKLKVWVAVGVSSGLLALISFLIYEFIIKRLG